MKVLRAAIEAEREATRAAAEEGGVAPWRDAANALQAELTMMAAREGATAGSMRIDPETVAEAARWHAEARAFAAELRRVDAARVAAVAQRDAEREGELGDFEAQMRRGGRRARAGPRATDAGSLQPGAAAEMTAARAGELRGLERATAAAKAEADALIEGEAAARAELQQQRARTAALQAALAELRSAALE